MSWADYWNEESTVYVSARHRQAHYDGIARDLVALLPMAGRVLDYGCGEALSAHHVAAACSHLLLCDSAPRLRSRLASRYGNSSGISVISPEQFEQLPDQSLDMIIANSVAQYFSASEFADFVAVAHHKLAPNGSLVLADLIPKTVGPLTDAVELLKFARVNGFLLAAAAGIGRSMLSRYGRTRARLGLLSFEEGELIDMLASAGFTAHRRYPNVGHNAKRMTIMAKREGSVGAARTAA